MVIVNIALLPYKIIKQIMHIKENKQFLTYIQENLQNTDLSPITNISILTIN